MTAFTPGIELSGAFYREAVRQLLGGRPHAAALLGWGSEVLGFDTPLVGAIDQFANSTDVLSDPAVYRRFASALVSPPAAPAA